MATRTFTLDELEFRAVPHEYYVRDRELPSVTMLMRKYSLGFTGYAPEEALNRGTWVHEASVLIDDGDLDWSSVPEQWRGYCEAYQRAVHENPARTLTAEARLFHPVYWYAGTLDRAVLIHRDGGWGIRELKTGSTEDVDAQVAAYRAMYEHWFPQRKIGFGECLKVNDDGSYRLWRLDLDEGWRVFAAILVIEERKRKKRASSRSSEHLDAA